MKTILLILLVSLITTQARHWLVGSASSTILPTINGKTDYVRPVDEFDATSPGTLTPKFDVGKINVGNGNSDCKWVRDDLRATVVTIQASPETTLVVVSADLYMFFQNDLEIYWNKTRERVQKRFGELKFLTHATHNHHGPDTLGGGDFVNGKYIEYVMDILVDITEKALHNMKPAKLHIAERKWAFGVRDARDPLLLDTDLRVMQATSLDDGKVIATILQWAYHPETTLGFSPKVNPADCRALGRPENCSANGLYFSADFPGHVQRVIREKVGGEVCYISGALGIQIGPKQNSTWEVSEKYPIIGDGSVPPPGAPMVQKNFRMALLVGRELALAALNELRTRGRVLEPPNALIVKETHFYTRITNIMYKIAMVLILGKPRIGYLPRKLYLCSNKTHPSDETCKDDEFKWELSDILLPKRIGEFIKTQVSLVDFGSGVKWLTIPGEMPPELYTGLPSDFNTNIRKYYNNPQWHAVGVNYTTPGSLRDMMKCASCWVLGLTNDELGYMVPISDWRQACNPSLLNCNNLPLEYPDSMSGRTCDWLVNNEEAAKRRYGSLFWGVRWICINGQMTQARHHYEETNSVGWNFVRDYFTAVRKLVS